MREPIGEPSGWIEPSSRRPTMQQVHATSIDGSRSSGKRARPSLLLDCGRPTARPRSLRSRWHPRDMCARSGERPVSRRSVRGSAACLARPGRTAPTGRSSLAASLARGVARLASARSCIRIIEHPRVGRGCDVRDPIRAPAPAILAVGTIDRGRPFPRFRDERRADGRASCERSSVSTGGDDARSLAPGSPGAQRERGEDRPIGTSPSILRSAVCARGRHRIVGAIRFVRHDAAREPVQFGDHGVPEPRSMAHGRSSGSGGGLVTIVGRGRARPRTPRNRPARARPPAAACVPAAVDGSGHRSLVASRGRSAQRLPAARGEVGLVPAPVAASVRAELRPSIAAHPSPRRMPLVGVVASPSCVSIIAMHGRASPILAPFRRRADGPPTRSARLDAIPHRS